MCILAASMLRAVLLLTFVSAAFAADDPFIGKWKLNLAKSKLTGQIIVIEEVSPDHWKFQEDEHTDIIFADGEDHVTHFGDSMAIMKKDANTWAITYKNGDKVLNTVWQISVGGQSLTYNATGTRPNGQHFNNKMILKRTAGTSGLAGTWQSTDVELSSPREIYISSYANGGHAITYPERKLTVRIKYDGKEYSEASPVTPEGSASSGHRIDDRTIETTEKIKGQVIETAKATISADGKAQTIVITEPGDKTPFVLVYDRE